MSYKEFGPFFEKKKKKHLISKDNISSVCFYLLSAIDRYTLDNIKLKCSTIY